MAPRLSFLLRVFGFLTSTTNYFVNQNLNKLTDLSVSASFPVNIENTKFNLFSTKINSAITQELFSLLEGGNPPPQSLGYLKNSSLKGGEPPTEMLFLEKLETKSISFSQMEVPISTKSRNLLTLLFCLFISNSSGSIFSSQLARKNLVKESLLKKNSFTKFTAFFLTQNSLSIQAFRKFSPTGGSLPHPRFEKSSNRAFSFLGFHGSHFKVPPFSFLILFYVLFIGLEGSATKFLFHEKRLSLTKSTQILFDQVS